MEERHPFLFYIPEGATTLICGTFPPVRSRWSFDFFYPNKMNLFWPVMANICKQDLKYYEGEKAVQERKEILALLRCGVTDMGRIVVRTQNNSLDENLSVVTYMDIMKMLEQYPGIRKVIFTSSSGKNSAFGWFLQYLRLQQINLKVPKGPKPWHFQLPITSGIIDIAVLLSTSRRAANRIGFQDLVALYQSEIT